MANEDRMLNKDYREGRAAAHYLSTQGVPRSKEFGAIKATVETRNGHSGVWVEIGGEDFGSIESAKANVERAQQYVDGAMDWFDEKEEE